MIAGATTPFEYGPSGFESIEEQSVMCLKEIQQDVPDFHLRDADLWIYSHFSVHFGHQLAPEWIIHDHLGLVGVPHFRVENGGNTAGSALYAAWLAVKSGQHHVVPIIGWETMDSVSQSQGSEFIALASDMRYELMVGGIYPLFYAGLAGLWMKSNNVTEEDCARIAVKNRNNAMDNVKTQWYRNERKFLKIEDVMNSRMIAYPIKKYDCCVMSRGMAAVIICDEEYAKKMAPDHYVVIDGIGLSSCTIRAGDRIGIPGWTEIYGAGYPDMEEFAACRRAADIVYKHAHISNPRKDINVMEIHDAFSTSEAQIYKALGIADKNNIGKFIRDGCTEIGGELPVNPGGGLLGYGHPVGATGLMSLTECYYQLAGLIGKKHLSKKGQVPNAEVGLMNSHAGTGTSISNTILRRP